ncbi:restriction endonuclease subunit M [Micromonospora sp. WMMA2032]|uniref:Eco57I restriction-modification methylase domain-containing protein n=1 Tax=Micromonospora sp. WMMA2032 TaxID=2039870 RepID=UPI000C0597C8|nr:DNA methyltransferase [Micromonospora sp. WMMA2032]ATO13236.1 restriction endonuclease subunit M [Micromonospora sp. WMMA2032]
MSEAPATVRRLVARFERDERFLRSPQYGEADSRKEFIDPLFTALGWDLSNASGHADAYKDVVHEYSLKVGGSHKAPDYSFRIGGVRKFFVEAKRPGVDIVRDSAPAYQLRRYAWTAKLPISVLTNFRNICVYDGSIRPEPVDSPAVGRTVSFAWNELIDRWDELENLLSKTAVYQGSLDRYGAASPRRRGTAEVDDAFLLQLEDWRAKLARSFASRNLGLNVDELNEAVQQTIDRLVFLRIAEDRGIEEYGQLESLVAKAGVYQRLITLFKAADTKYNSGLFHFKSERGQLSSPDMLTPQLDLDDKVLRDVVRSTYYPRSPYEFSVLPSDILGQAYEQFLGKIITLTAGHRAVVQEKPEVKKSGGVYYTPALVARYVIDRTLGPALTGKTPRQALNVRVLDPACGSGSFLIAAYDYLLNWFTDAYLNAGPSAQKRYLHTDPHGNVRLNISERKRILTSCIFGVDIDRQAVEVTKLSLMIKVLEGESAETINAQLPLFSIERVLPDLNDNIQVGNSLVSDDVYDAVPLTSDEDDALRPFNWHSRFPGIFKAGGFNVVVGNPPYDVLEKQRGAASWPHAALRAYLPARPDLAPALGGKLNLYRLFLVESISLTRDDGYLGMIVPLGLVGDVSTAQTRRHILGSIKNLLLDCFPQKDNPRRRIFKRAKLSTVIVSGQVSRRPLPDRNTVTTRVFPGNSLTEDALVNQLQVRDCVLMDPKNVPVPLTDQAQWDLLGRLHAQPFVVMLGSVGEYYSVSRGEINQTIYRRFISPRRDLSRMLKGVEVGPFGLRTVLSQGEREWFDAQAFGLMRRRSTRSFHGSLTRPSVVLPLNASPV